MFRPRFAALVEAGKKRQTVRPRRKRPTLPGDWLSLREWTGRPYKSPQRVLREAECRMICESFEIGDDGNFWLAGSVLSPDGQERFAVADGFENRADMLRWFEAEHGLPFLEGEVVYW